MIKLPPALFSSLLRRRLSLRVLKVICAGVISCIVIAMFTLWRPAYLQLGSLQEAKNYWQGVLNKGAIKTNTTIPAMDQLPEMIEYCRSAFVDLGVEVVSFNVERFGERREAGQGARIDYALVRMHLVGQGEGIVMSLEKLEKMQGVSIHVQEVALVREGGEVLLQIHFCTG